MRRIIVSLLVFLSVNSYADDVQEDLGTSAIIEIVEKDNKLDLCVEEYIKKQSRPHAKIVQDTLYDLIHNFDNIISRIYGKKQANKEIAYEEKVETLARLQCEVYHEIGELK